MQKHIDILSRLEPENKPENHPHSCSHCGSQNIRSGAGLKPGQQSQRCSDCGEFLGYSPVKTLKKLRKRQKLTDSLNLLESHGIRSEEAQLFLLSEVGCEV
jgi:hypothetical protein